MRIAPRQFLALVVFAGVTIAAGCREAAAPPSIEASISPLCQLGCVEEDPDPTAPGVFLGSGVTPLMCGPDNPNGINDRDQDGLSDFCETNIAAAFAPQVYYWHLDDVRGEPHWVARPYLDREVVIGYLESYYYDEGTFATGCHLSPYAGWCVGHNGDSEAIFLYVYYDFDTQHWVLDHADHPQHGGYGVYTRSPGEAYPSVLTYPSHKGSYPKAWVAEGKHANYAGRLECDHGGFVDSDDCDLDDTAARVATGVFLNLGSSQLHTTGQDCMASSNPSYEYYGAGRIECYWSGQEFRGWVPDSIGGPSSDPYINRLQAFGF